MAVKISSYMKVFVLFAAAYLAVAQTTDEDYLSTDSVTDSMTTGMSTKIPTTNMPTTTVPEDESSTTMPTTNMPTTTVPEDESSTTMPTTNMPTTTVPEDESSTTTQEETTTNDEEMTTSNEDEQTTTPISMTSNEITSEMSTKIMADKSTAISTSTTMKETTTKMSSTDVASTTTPKTTMRRTPRILTTIEMTKPTKKDCPTPEPIPPATTPKKPATTVASAKVTQPLVQTTGSGETAFGRIGLPLFAVTLAALILLVTALVLMYIYRKYHSGSHLINPASVEMGTRPKSPMVDMTAGFGNVQTIDLEEEDKKGNGKDGVMSTFSNQPANNVDTFGKESNPAPETPSWLKVEPSQQNSTLNNHDQLQSDLQDDVPNDTSAEEVKPETEKPVEKEEETHSDSSDESYHGSETEGEGEEEKEEEDVSPDTPMLPKDSNTDEMVSVDLNTNETNI